MESSYSSSRLMELAPQFLASKPWRDLPNEIKDLILIWTFRLADDHTLPACLYEAPSCRTHYKLCGCSRSSGPEPSKHCLFPSTDETTLRQLYEAGQPLSAVLNDVAKNDLFVIEGGSVRKEQLAAVTPRLLPNHIARSIQPSTDLLCKSTDAVDKAVAPWAADLIPRIRHLALVMPGLSFSYRAGLYADLGQWALLFVNQDWLGDVARQAGPDKMISWLETVGRLAVHSTLWITRVDFGRYARLTTLFLDLRHHTRHMRSTSKGMLERGQVEALARGMSCLELEKLVVMGLMSAASFVETDNAVGAGVLQPESPGSMVLDVMAASGSSASAETTSSSASEDSVASPGEAGSQCPAEPPRSEQNPALAEEGPYMSPNEAFCRERWKDPPGKSSAWQDYESWSQDKRHWFDAFKLAMKEGYFPEFMDYRAFHHTVHA